MELKFFNRSIKKTIEINVTYYNYFYEIIHKIKEGFSLDINKEIKVFCIGDDLKSKVFVPMTAIEDMKILSNKIRHFEVFWKNDQHGKQTQDLSPSNIGAVVSGYKRWVSSNPNAGGVTVGDPSGASIYIPAGAISEDTNVSIKI